MHIPYRAVALTTGAILVASCFTPIGSATAATAKSVLLGKSNKTTKVTTIQNTKGVALSLKSKTGKAPLAVNSTTKVANLNSDLLDGLTSSKLARSGAVVGTIVASGGDVALCPKGTTITGGGGLAAGGLAYSGPGLGEETFVPNSWSALPIFDEEVYSIAKCYSPLGKIVPGSLEEQATLGLSTKSMNTANTGYLKLLNKTRAKVAAK